MLNPNKVEDLQSIEKTRNIVNEILRYGVRELEIKKIIDLLSLELEDTDCMRQIQSIIKEKPQQEEVEIKKNNLIL